MRVLAVEDEPDLLGSLIKALREDGYAVDGAPDGEDGLYKAESYDYDAIVLDIMLPGIDGWELLRRLRKTKKTPVLMLTARDAVRDRVRGLDTGADDYLVKPFELAELLARLRALIRRSASQAQARLEIGGVVIDTAARTVTRNGEAVIAHRPRVRAGGVPRAAPRQSRHPHHALRASLRRKRRHPVQSPGRARLEHPQEARPRLHHHPARPRLLHRMIFNSIRWRLQAWHGLILVVVLAGFGFTAYHVARDNQLRRIDQDLDQRLMALLRPQPPDRPPDRPPDWQRGGPGKRGGFPPNEPRNDRAFGSPDFLRHIREAVQQGGDPGSKPDQHLLLCPVATGRLDPGPLTRRPGQCSCSRTSWTSVTSGS